MSLRTTKKEFLRRCKFSPYKKGMGPTFTLTLYDVPVNGGTRSHIGYKLTKCENGETVIIFTGSNVYFNPGHGKSIDGDASVRNIIGFLTHCDRDVDYTLTQDAFFKRHADNLSLETMYRFREAS